MRQTVEIDLKPFQLAKILRVSRKTVYAMCEKKILPAHQVGVAGQYRVDAERLRAWMAENGYPAERLDRFLETL
jgi:excisionase family DNA binding protein